MRMHDANAADRRVGGTRSRASAAVSQPGGFCSCRTALSAGRDGCAGAHPSDFFPVRLVLHGAGFLLLILTLWPTAVLAHGMHVFASVEGRTITGRAYFRKSAPAKDARVRLQGPDGQTLQSTRTDADGAFRFTVAQRGAYTIRVDTPDGHSATWTVADEEFGAGPTAQQGSNAEAESPAPAPAPAARTEDAPLTRAEAERLFQRLRAEQRKELAAFEDRERVRDVVAGIGFLLGLTGIAFYFLGVRRKEKQGRA